MLEVASARSNSLSEFAKTTGNSADVDIAILPDAAKLVFRGGAAAAEAAGAAFGAGLPQAACRSANAGNKTVYWLGPDEWMLQAVNEDSATLVPHLEAALSRYPHSLVDVSHRSDAFSVTGTSCEFLLNHGCPLDLSLAAFPVGMCTRTIFEKAPILLSRPEPQVFHVDVWRSFVPYVWQFLAEARRGLD